MSPCQNGKTVKYPYGFMGTHSVAQNLQVSSVGTGFVGAGAGWTSPTCTVPMCHPIVLGKPSGLDPK